MTVNTANLTNVWQGDDSWSVGRGGVTAITIRTDGHGLSGFYDRIHIDFEDGDTITLPAHQCDGWRTPGPAEKSDD